MRRRPQPNRRRGLLRAAAVVIILLALVVVVIAVISSLTAPSVNAPTPPATPPPLPTPTPAKKSAKPVTPAAHPTATHTPKKHLGLGPTGGILHEIAPGRALPDLLSASAHGSIVAFFGGRGPLSQRALFLHDRTSGRLIRIGAGDSLQRPVWSPDGGRLVYVRVTQTRGVPGASWTLVQYNVATRRSQNAATVSGMNMTPLGWSHGKLLYLVATATDTSAYSAGPGRSLVGMLMPQPVSTASLSPNGRYIALGAPANCAYCTINIYDLGTLDLWTGPTGMPSELDLAWSDDGTHLVVPLGNRLAVIDASSHAVREFGWPANLPRRWSNRMVARITSSRLTLVDSDNQTYTSMGGS